MPDPNRQVCVPSVLERSPFRLRSLSLSLSLLALGAALSLPACSRTATPAKAPESAAENEQALVERSAAAFERLRKNPRFAAMDGYLARARGVLIFPRLVKASLVFGGEGGSGVLVARRPDGSWSEPAFYSLGAPSVGLQVGYQEATVVLFIMRDSTLERALDSSFALGTKAGTTLGLVGDHDGTRADVLSATIYQVVDAEGAFAGVSLDGYVIRPRSSHNRDYYGKAVTPRGILLDNAAQGHEHGAPALDRALAVQSNPSPRDH